MKYFKDRFGRIHVKDEKRTGFWTVALCGGGDFEELRHYNGGVTCDICREKLGMGVQLEMDFSENRCCK